MVSYGLDKAAAQAVWQPFLDWIAAAPQDFRLTRKPTIADLPARNWWDAEFRKKHTADAIISDPRPGADPRDFSWTGDHDQIGAFWRSFETLWLPSLFDTGQSVPQRQQPLGAERGSVQLLI
jgi:hypothetical protein